MKLTHNISSSRVLHLTLLVAVAFLGAILLYDHTIEYGFDWDDYHQVRPYTLNEIMTSFWGNWDPTHIEKAFYRPLTVVYYAVRFYLFGYNPRYHHWTGIVLFATAATLVGLFFYRTFNSVFPTLIGIALFLTHPGVAYSLVTWPSIQFQLFQLLVILIALLWWQVCRDRATVWWIPLVLLEIAAFMIKEDSIMLLPCLAFMHAIYKKTTSDDAIGERTTLRQTGGTTVRTGQMVRSIFERLRERGLHIVFALSMVALFGIYYTKLTSPFFLNLGTESDKRHVRNFYDPEQSHNLDYRWTKDSSYILVPNLGHIPVQIELGADGARPEEEPPPKVALIANGEKVADFVATSGILAYQFDYLPTSPPFPGDLLLEIKSETFAPPDDVYRPLGILVNTVTVKPLFSPLSPRPLLVCLTAALTGTFLVSFGYLLLRHLGISQLKTSGFCLLMFIALAFALAKQWIAMRFIFICLGPLIFSYAVVILVVEHREPLLSGWKRLKATLGSWLLSLRPASAYFYAVAIITILALLLVRHLALGSKLGGYSTPTVKTAIENELMGPYIVLTGEYSPWGLTGGKLYKLHVERSSTYMIALALYRLFVISVGALGSWISFKKRDKLLGFIILSGFVILISFNLPSFLSTKISQYHLLLLGHVFILVGSLCAIWSGLKAPTARVAFVLLIVLAFANTSYITIELTKDFHPCSVMTLRHDEKVLSWGEIVPYELRQRLSEKYDGDHCR